MNVCPPNDFLNINQISFECFGEKKNTIKNRKKKFGGSFLREEHSGKSFYKGNESLSNFLTVGPNYSTII